MPVTNPKITTGTKKNYAMVIKYPSLLGPSCKIGKKGIIKRQDNKIDHLKAHKIFLSF